MKRIERIIIVKRAAVVMMKDLAGTFNDITIVSKIPRKRDDVRKRRFPVGFVAIHARGRRAKSGQHSNS